MGYYPLLPKLKETSAVNPGGAGKWLSNNANFLHGLIESLHVLGTIEEIGEINSIPDMWARPLLFEMALFDMQNAKQRQFIPGLHDQILGEWRGLLAMFALKEVKHLDLKAIEVLVDSTQKNEFIAALAKQVPETFISKDTKWNRIYVLTYKNVPIGMTSPTTLVCSAADYSAARLTEPWSRAKYIEDPIEHLTGEELKMLFSWVKNLTDNLRKHHHIIHSKTPQYIALLQRLEEYLDAIEVKVEEIDHEYIRDSLRFEDFSFIESNLHLNNGILRYLDTCIAPKAASVQDSHVCLVSSEGRNPEKSLLIFGKDISSKWGVPASKLLLWPGLPATAIEYGVRSKSRNNVEGITFNNAEYRYPDELFHDRLVAIGFGNALPGTEPVIGADQIQRGNSAITPLLPVKKELLEYLTCQDIVQRISFQDTKEGIMVRFRFPLLGCGKGKTDYVFEKTYPKDSIVVIGTPPVLEVWPEFKLPNWKQYYVYYKNHYKGSSLRQDLAKNTFFADPWAYGAEKENIPDGGKSNHYVGCITSFPEALVCSVNVQSQDNPRGEIMAAGIVVLRQPEHPPEYGSRHWKIGIDFGTSGTMVYRKEDKKSPVPLSFQSRLFKVTESMDLRTDLYLDFLPGEPEKETSSTKGSFLSIFHLLGSQVTKEQLRPLLDGHIYLLRNYEDFASKGNSIETNLKWQTSQEGRSKTIAYLKQVCLQCAAEAVGNGVISVDWSFSYSTAFSRQDFESFRGACREAAENACRISGLPIPNNIAMETESIATALCFSQLGNYLGTFARGAVCVDIGSGTSDISFWQGSPPRILYQTSVRFAGRQLFRPLVMTTADGKLPMLGETIAYVLSDKQIEWLRMLNQNHEDTVYTIIDSVLRKAGDYMLKTLSSKTSEEPVKRVLQNMTIGLSGLFYYIGLVLRQLHAKGLYANGKMPNIYVGGNGSRVFDWVANGKLQDDSAVLRLLKNIIQDTSDMQSDNFTIRLSNIPKAEVAYGLVNEKPNFIYDDEESLIMLYPQDNNDYITYRPVMAGENYVQDGQKMAWSSFINAKDIHKGIDIDCLDQFEQFVKTFNKFSRDAWTGKIIQGDNHDILRGIKDQIEQQFVNQIGKKEQDIRVEPIFISSLAWFMDRYTNE